MIAPHRAALQALTESGVAFVTIGSAALALRAPSVAEAYALPDLDVLVTDARAAQRMGAWLHAQGWSLTCWGEAWSPTSDDDALVGKAYLRGTNAGLTLDVTFESSTLDAGDCIARAEWVGGVPLCPLDALWFSKLSNGYADGMRFAARHGLTIPPSVHARLAAAPALDRRPEVLAAHASDWSLAAWRAPSAVALPDSVSALARVLVWASVTGTRVTVQGQRRSAAGQAMADGAVALSTARLDRIVALSPDQVTVEAGVRWDRLVRETLAVGRVPPVLTSFLPATVGGTLSTPAFSRGSHRLGLQFEHVLSLEVVTGDGRAVRCSPAREPWLFHAALGGLGRFGVIARATLRLVPAPARLTVQKRPIADVTALRDAVFEAARDPRSYHVTAFPEVTGDRVRWAMVTAAEADGDAGAETVAFAAYAAPPRPERPTERATWMHWFVPAEGLAPLLARYAETLSFAGGDGVQVLPVLKRAAPTASLARLPTVPDGALVAGVCLVREHRGRDLTALDNETRALADFARALGATSTLGGALPTDAAGWRAQLGASADDVLATLRRADPMEILGGAATRALAFDSNR